MGLFADMATKIRSIGARQSKTSGEVERLTEQIDAATAEHAQAVEAVARAESRLKEAALESLDAGGDVAVMLGQYIAPATSAGATSADLVRQGRLAPRATSTGRIGRRGGRPVTPTGP